jgi:hypothetical protein
MQKNSIHINSYTCKFQIKTALSSENTFMGVSACFCPVFESRLPDSASSHIVRLAGPPPSVPLLVPRNVGHAPARGDERIQRSDNASKKKTPG